MLENTIKGKAIIENDKSFNGCFFYAVKSTGVFCRSSCKSRLPLRKNVDFFNTTDKAVKAGYSSCKRCHPDLAGYNPVFEIADKLKSIIDTYYCEKNLLA